MSGLVIVVITLLVIAAFVLVVKLSESALEALNELYNDTPRTDHQTAKALLLIPYILLFLWVLLIKIILFFITLGAVISIAGDLRNWWHKGPKK